MSEALVRRLLWEVRVLRILVIALAIGGTGVIAQVLPLNDSPIVTRELTSPAARKARCYGSAPIDAPRSSCVTPRDACGYGSVWARKDPRC